MSETANAGAQNSEETPVTVRLPAHALSALDGWIATQPGPRLSRPDAVMRILGQILDFGDAGSIDVGDLNASNDE